MPSSGATARRLLLSIVLVPFLFCGEFAALPDTSTCGKQDLLVLYYVQRGRFEEACLQYRKCGEYVSHNTAFSQMDVYPAKVLLFFRMARDNVKADGRSFLLPQHPRRGAAGPARHDHEGIPAYPACRKRCRRRTVARGMRAQGGLGIRMANLPTGCIGLWRHAPALGSSNRAAGNLYAVTMRQRDQKE
jgi:hypothetical protein